MQGAWNVAEALEVTIIKAGLEHVFYRFNFTDVLVLMRKDTLQDIILFFV